MGIADEEGGEIDLGGSTLSIGVGHALAPEGASIWMEQTVGHQATIVFLSIDQACVIANDLAAAIRAARELERGRPKESSD